MTENIDKHGYGSYLFRKVEEDDERPVCFSCGDPVRIVYHSGGIPMYAQHCRECYAELRWGKIPPANRRRKSL